MNLKLLSNQSIAWITILAFVMSFAVSCGPAEEETETDDDYDEEDDYEEAADYDQEIDLEIVASGNNMGEIKFEVDEVSVPANAKVTLTLINNSEGAGMDHNFVVVEEEHLEDIVDAGLAAGPDNEFLPDGGHEGLIAASPLAAPGETITYEFITPSEPGEYLFICLYPGHVDAMQGPFIVE